MLMRGLDTSLPIADRQRDLIAALTPAERLSRAFALSAVVREFAMAGAVRTAGGLGPAPIRRRFLEQVYGAKIAAWVEERVTVSGSP